MIILPAMTDAQEQAWQALLEISSRLGHKGWCLIGGQLVHLHCFERGASPNRPTDDGDAALDVRGYPDVLMKFTLALRALGFQADGSTPEGHQHRWIRDKAKIDILIPTGVGLTAANRRGASGGTTLQSPGLQQALDRVDVVTVAIKGVEGTLPRPNLLGALVVKAAAYSVTNDPSRGRHLLDLAVLASLITRGDQLRQNLTAKDRVHLRNAITGLTAKRAEWISIDGAEQGVERLVASLSTNAG